MHVMESLSSLSKFAGCYEKWRNIVSKYQLEWSNDYSLDTFKDIILDQY
jgi:hypothetical protein